MISELPVIEIEQKMFLRGTQKFEIHSNQNLECTFKRFSVHRQFQIPLWQIDSSPERLRYRPLGSMTASFVFGGLVAATIVAAIVTHKSGGWAFLLFNIFLLPVFASVLWKTYFESVDCLAFALRQGGQLQLWFEKPDPKTFQEFCNTLKTRSASQQHPINLNPQSLAEEIKELKKLAESGVLSEAEFEKAKAKLIEATSERRIGFQ